MASPEMPAPTMRYLVERVGEFMGPLQHGAWVDVETRRVSECIARFEMMQKRKAAHLVRRWRGEDGLDRRGEGDQKWTRSRAPTVLRLSVGRRRASVLASSFSTTTTPLCVTMRLMDLIVGKTQCLARSRLRTSLHMTWRR